MKNCEMFYIGLRNDINEVLFLFIDLFPIFNYRPAEFFKHGEYRELSLILLW
jgi:hypothetical protein